MFGKIAGFEFRYQLRQPVFWVVTILFFLLSFGSVALDGVQIGSGGNVLRNSAVAIAQTHAILGIFYMFVTAAFVANVIVRDVETGFGPIVHATRMSKFDYLYGRFTGAWLAATLSFLAVTLGMFVGTLMPWIDKEAIGPNNIAFYLYAFLGLGVPAVFLTSAIFFTLATVTRSMMATYVGVVAMLVIYSVVLLVFNKPDYRSLMAYAEPFGLSGLANAVRYWSPHQRNTEIPDLQGAIVWGRVMWMGVGVVFLLAAYALFRVETRGSKAKKLQKLKALASGAAPAPIEYADLPKPRFNAGTARAQLWARTKFEMGQVFKSPAYFVLMALGLFNSLFSLWQSAELFGTGNYLITRLAISGLEGAFGIIPFIIAIYYAGELVWRERDRHTHEIIDSTAVPDWAFVVPKTLALVLVLFSTLIISVIGAIAVQALKGVTDFELQKYLLWYILPQTIIWTLYAILALFIQVVSPHKFIGWGVMLVYFIGTSTLAGLGFDHRLMNYASTPDMRMSDMNGLGDYWKGAAWLELYWGAFAAVLLVLAYALWRRGTETRFWPRLVRLPRRLKGAPGLIALLAIVIFAGSGAYIYTNTNVWNIYRTDKDRDQLLADYETILYVPYKDIRQPTIVAVKLDVDLHPTEPRVVTTGSYVLENQTDAPISELHVRGPDPDMSMALSVPGAKLKKDYPRFKYSIYTFDQPMQPGERRVVGFQTVFLQQGFPNTGATTRVVDNGTFISNNEISPFIGINREGLLTDRKKRKDHKLTPEDLVMPALGAAGADRINYLRRDSGFVAADITVTTDADQTPIAPGYKQSDVTRNGRRTAHFVSDTPIMHFFSIQSARYAVRSKMYKGVEIAVYFDPAHAWNVDRMIKAAETSLDYYQANFSPYQFRQMRFIEFPAYAEYAQSFPNTMAWSESAGFIADNRDPTKIDYVTYIAAHEIAHQWWAHQIIGADEQGSTVLSETLASYSALMVMEKLYGPDKIRRFLKFELDTYLRGRASERLNEHPLAEVENQGYIHYSKGGMVMYLLRDRMGEARVNAALRHLLAQYAYKGAPYPTSRDLLAALRAEAGGDRETLDLIDDMFNRIIIYDLQATSASVRKRADGRFDVTVVVNTRKLEADEKGGKEKQVPLNESFEVGLFTAEPGKPEFSQRDVIEIERRALKGGVEKVTFIANRRPTWVGIDPYNRRIDRNSDDNVVKVGE